MEKEKSLQNYISTPFAYTKFAKNLTLLQQSILNKVSEHLQDYIKKYYGSTLCKSHDVPRPLFSLAEKNNGIPDFVILYAELGVSLNNYPVANAAVKEVMALTVDAPGYDKNGNPAIVKYNIFTKANMSSIENNGVAFSLNKDVVDYVFDMSQGYVRHPVDIARIGKVERMPMIYYYLFKKSEKWRNRIVCLTVMEIKDYLGISAKEITEEDGIQRKRRGNSGKELYPKYAMFRTRVLDKSVEDINRLKKAGLIDVCVFYESVYNGKRKTGNPSYIKFYIFDSLNEMNKVIKQIGVKSVSLFEPVQDVSDNNINIQQPIYTEEYLEDWGSLLETYNGSILEILKRGRPMGKNTLGWLVITFAKEDAELLNGNDEWLNVCNRFKEMVGIKHGPGIQIDILK